MYLTRLRLLSIEDTFTCLKRVRLKGLYQQQVYKDAIFSLEQAVLADMLTPTQRYILKPNLEKIFNLINLFSRRDVNIFRLGGATLFWLKSNNNIEEGPVTVTPPIVEEFQEIHGNITWLLNDGMHRVNIARRLQIPLNILLIRNIPNSLPYYALPLSNGWRDVEELDTLPAEYKKKIYRQPENYKALFRDFNAVFPGIQRERYFLRTLETPKKN